MLKPCGVMEVLSAGRVFVASTDWSVSSFGDQAVASPGRRAALSCPGLDWGVRCDNAWGRQVHLSNGTYLH